MRKAKFKAPGVRAAPGDLESNAVLAWFGSAFGQLHPQLQELHRVGGSLSGNVRIEFAQGLAGIIGRRIARTLGIPLAATSGLEVCIHSRDGALHWHRRFATGTDFKSVFVPVGHYPEGHWIESTGRVQVVLGVAVVDGAWRWEHRQTRLWGLPLPRWFAPRTIASKEIAGSDYVFRVEVVVPLFRTVVSYAGVLTPTSPLSPHAIPAATACATGPHGATR
jgi:hypothetical protein